MNVGDSNIDALLMLAALEGRRDNHALAREYYERVLAKATDSNNRAAQSIALHELGMLLQRERKLFEAEQCYHRSLELAKQIGDDNGAATTMGQLGKLKELQDDDIGALLLYFEAENLFKKLNSPMKAQVENDKHRLIAKIALDQYRINHAKKYRARHEGLKGKVLRWLRIK
jgi:tetratricopeptide (TPR) repeat protein